MYVMLFVVMLLFTGCATHQHMQPDQASATIHVDMEERTESVDTRPQHVLVVGLSPQIVADLLRVAALQNGMQAEKLTPVHGATDPHWTVVITKDNEARTVQILQTPTGSKLLLD